MAKSCRLSSFLIIAIRRSTSPLRLNEGKEPPGNENEDDAGEADEDIDVDEDEEEDDDDNMFGTEVVVDDVEEI